ncbi:MAG TPA: hypothetical protein VGQ83_41335 [Polyangia bacterium]|jgi:DNA uptake protein ComE-like DNA-binding protein
MAEQHRHTNLNVAGKAELAQTTGAGPERAAGLVSSHAQRGPFREWEDVERVPGRLRDLLRHPRVVVNLQ